MSLNEPITHENSDAATHRVIESTDSYLTTQILPNTLIGQIIQKIHWFTHETHVTLGASALAATFRPVALRPDLWDVVGCTAIALSPVFSVQIEKLLLLPFSLPSAQ